MMRNIQTREGFEFWDKLNALPRYAFLLSPSGKSVQKFEDQAMGNWIDVHEAQKVVDQAQDQISELRASYRALGELYAGTQKGFERMQAERDALQQRLNAADQRIDELTSPPLTDELRWILGQMCFQHIHTAQALRLMGHEIAKKAEEEQAVTIHWMLGHYLKDPQNWRQNASAELKAAAPAA